MPIFFTDLDGTLLTDDKKVTTETYEAIKAFTQRGGLFVACSGRAVGSILRVLEQNNLLMPGMLAISYNGALIYDCDKGCPIHEIKVKKEHAVAMMRLAHEKGVYLQTYIRGALVAMHSHPTVEEYIAINPMPTVYDETLSAVDEDPYKLLGMSFDHEELVAFQAELEKLDFFPEMYHSFYSSPVYLEVTRKDATKGNAVLKTCELLGIPLSETYAAGDGENDIPMLQTVTHGYAMLNAPQFVKDKARYVTARDNNHDGVADILNAIR